MVIAIANPVLLTQIGWAVDNEFTRSLVICDGGLHLNGVVAVAQFSETEAAYSLQTVNLVEEIIMLPIVECETGASKKVHLDSVLDSLCWVNKAHKLVRAENIVRVSIELFHRHQTLRENFANLGHRVVACICHVSVVVDRDENWVAEGAEPVVAFLGRDVEQL